MQYSFSGRIKMDEHIRQALAEDVTQEDLSTNAVVDPARQGTVELICKQDGVLAGIDVFCRVFALLDPKVQCAAAVHDGEAIRQGQVIARIQGSLRALLTGERTALNYLQHMSGIATYTRGVADVLEGTGIALLDTRKTTPTLRLFDKYAVKVGGGKNHRFNLSDGIMLKDNHIAAAGGIRPAVERARAYASHVYKIEVEAETLDMVQEAAEAGADIIMLDNMSPELMKEAVRLIAGRAATECSGNVTKENIARYLDLGIDYISVGALTHSAPILDFSMKNLRAID